MTCLYSIPPGGGLTGDTLEDFAAYFADEFARRGWRLDGVGYLSVPCDGYSPDLAQAHGCTPVTSMQPTW